MRPFLALSAVCSLALLSRASIADTPDHVAAASSPSAAHAEHEPPVLTARVVAVGIPGAGAVSGVGFFHAGGPIHDNPAFAAFTQPGHILDPKRILVASSSNFGLPRAREEDPEGAVLSLDPEQSETIVIPPDFATGGGQAVALNGRLQLFTAQSKAFLNGVNTPQAATADWPPVSNPLGISINNAFGRLWFASAPEGTHGIGTISIADPGGQPLANAPNRLGGGVFAGDLTNRPRQVIPGGLRAGGIANALLGMSPDGSKRAVFAGLTADGALVQAHTEQAIDGLAPAGTVSPLTLPAVADSPGAETSLITRAGMVFNWVPDRILYVTDPVRNALVALKLSDDGAVFKVDEVHTIAVPDFDRPVDLAPAVPEVANPTFSSNTTLAGNSDLYVLNRGNGTITRLRQDGTVLAVRRIATAGGTPLGAARLNGIAVSPDAQHIWVTMTGVLPQFPDKPGALLEIPAFGPQRSATRNAAEPDAGRASDEAALVAWGAELFSTAFSPEQGLGPLFNRQSCVECHSEPAPGGGGPNGLAVAHRVGHFDGRSYDPLVGNGGPVARAHSVTELGVPCASAPPAGIPPAANLVSVRNAPALFGSGLLDAIPDSVILSHAETAKRNGGNDGRPNLVRDSSGHERVGRYGWKADTATLEQFVADAFRNELGITSPLAPTDFVSGAGCVAGAVNASEDDGSMIRAVATYIASLPPPSAQSPPNAAGSSLFSQLGCTACHTPSLTTADGRDVPLYSDLLLHDMGPTLDDGVEQGSAHGQDWRTTPLWGLSSRGRFLHDGRATSIGTAVLAHDGSAARSAAAFRRLASDEREVLLAFLKSL